MSKPKTIVKKLPFAFSFPMAPAAMPFSTLSGVAWKENHASINAA
jgi:hypothetical protein